MTTLTVGFYLACVLAALCLTLLARWRPRWIARPGQLVTALVVSPAGRIALVAFWWWLGWHFLIE